jgi:hypothetical protein
MKRARKRSLPRRTSKPGYFPNTYLLRGTHALQAGLVQQTVQIVDSHDLTLFVGPRSPPRQYPKPIGICPKHHIVVAPKATALSNKLLPLSLGVAKALCVCFMPCF